MFSGPVGTVAFIMKNTAIAAITNSVNSRMRPEKPEQGVRLKNVRHETFDGDLLMRGELEYPEKMLIDETVFGVR